MNINWHDFFVGFGCGAMAAAILTFVASWLLAVTAKKHNNTDSTTYQH